MLRTIFVAILACVGVKYAMRDAFGGLLFYLWLAYFRPETWMWSSDWYVALNMSFLCGIVVVTRSAMSGAKFKVDLRSGLMFAYLALSLISTILSDNSGYSWGFWIDFLKSIVITYLIATLVTDESKFRIVLLVIAWSLGFETAKQGWAQLLLNPGGKNFNTVPTLGDENSAAVGMFMLAPILVALGRTAVDKRERWIHRFVTIGVIYRGISTYSRGGFLALFALAGMFLMRSKYKFRALAAACVVAAIILPVMPQEYWDRMGTIRTASDPNAADPANGDYQSAQGRLHFWSVAIKMANAHPFVGVGHNGYNPAYDRYDFSAGAFGQSRSVHSTWFGVLAEAGYVGFALYLSILVLALIGCSRVVRQAKRGEISANLGHYATAIQTALIVFCVGGSFVPIMYIELLWHSIGLCIALRALAVASPVTVKSTEPLPSAGVNPHYRPAAAASGGL